MLVPYFNFTKISAGERYVLAITASGGYFAWGFNNKGQLDNELTSTFKEPVQVNFE